MGQFYLELKRNKETYKTLQGYANKSSIQNAEHNTKHYPRTDEYNKSGIYQMKCLDCPLKYTGQTGRTSHTSYEEHT
jgi:uncharacterized protein YegP (UPF0339 family)